VTTPPCPRSISPVFGQLSHPVDEHRTAGLVLIGLGWEGYGAGALTRPTPLFALDRMIAAWLAVAATSR
jgi:hypothetical protein